jgi:hypothetical protein
MIRLSPAYFNKYFLQDTDISSHIAGCFAHLGKNAKAQGISLLHIASDKSFDSFLLITDR